jgi:VWFA-related protein
MPVSHNLPLRALVVASLVALGSLAPSSLHLAAQQASQPAAQRPPTFRSHVDLVLVNVVVRDKNGAPVRGLTRDDFIVTEDNKPQSVATFGYEELATAPAESLTVTQPAMPVVLGSVGRAVAAAPKPAAAEVKPYTDAHGRRLIVMLFDLSSMQPEETKRALDSARDYVKTKASAADTLSIVTLSTSLNVVVDFTSDRDAILQAIDRMSGVEGMGFEEQAAADAEAAAADTGFTADDSEFTVFNTDRRLEALKSLTDAMATIEQKKSLIYFSSGMTQTGLDNRVAIRSVIDHATKANVSIYSADMRGLQAMVPGGDATTASTRGQSAFSGRAVSSRMDTMTASQDALSTLSEDTGGRAFFDINNFAGVFDKIVSDTSAYYILGFESSNRLQDGRFRRLKVTLKRPDLKLEYRAGYYAARDYAHAGKDDREQQLTEQLFSDLSVTDLPVYAAAAYFRDKGGRYFVPLWLVVPGARIPFNASGQKDKATLDIVGMLRDEQNRPVGRIRDTINLAVATTAAVRQKNVQYQTDFDLPPGMYKLKVVVRENQAGTMGSFETTIAVPNLDRDAMKLSSIVLGTQVQPATKKNERSPLIHDGQELLANVAHVVASSQHLYFYYEMYDPAIVGAPPAVPAAAGAPAGTQGTAAAAPQGRAATTAANEPIRVLSNVVFFQGKTRVYETPLVEAQVLSVPDRKATSFQLDVPASDLKPGLYTCQVNVIDDVGGTFALPRLALYVRK